MSIINAMRSWQGLGVSNDPTDYGLPANCGSAAEEYLQ